MRDNFNLVKTSRSSLTFLNKSSHSSRRKLFLLHEILTRYAIKFSIMLKFEISNWNICCKCWIWLTFFRIMENRTQSRKLSHQRYFKMKITYKWKKNVISYSRTITVNNGIMRKNIIFSYMSCFTVKENCIRDVSHF